MSAIFQRPVCDMGAAYDFAFRPLVGDADPGAGGPCDDRPHRSELCSAASDPRSAAVAWRGFSLCPEHEAQLRSYDQRVQGKGLLSRFRLPAPPTAGTHAR
jgi:hypothetical protein